MKEYQKKKTLQKKWKGIVLEPEIMLYNKNFKRIKCKCRYRDVVKLEANK